MHIQQHVVNKKKLRVRSSSGTAPLRTISTALEWPCDANVPQANSKPTIGYSSEWQKT